METTNNSVIARERQETVVASSSTRIKDMWRDFQEKKSRNGTFVAFDDYRQSLGGRGIWGTKIFFRSLRELSFIIDCEEDNDSTGRYCPTEYAINKYGDMFKWDEEQKLWGLSETHLDMFDEKIFPALLSTARKLEAVYKEEKKEKARAKYAENKASEKANQPVNIGVLI